MSDRQPLDLDTIEARAMKSPLWIDALQADAIELEGKVRYETNARGDSITRAAPVAKWLRAHRSDHAALIAEVKRLRSELAAPAPQPDPLDENDHRDRVDRHGDIVRRKGPQGWGWPETAAWRRGFCLTLDCINDEYGPLTFADDPQHTQEAQNRPQPALDRAALADIAQAAHKLAQAICDWLDLKEDQ